MGQQQLNVIYIAGPARSGSTILGDILGQVENFFHVGELISIWQMGLIRDSPCGCGESLEDCPVWSPVLDSLFDRVTKNGLQEDYFLQLSRNIPRTYSIPFYILFPSLYEGEYIDEYSDLLLNLYFSIQEQTGCKWIVDSSKLPSHAYLLSRMKEINLIVVHLIRDSRAVAYSWKRSDIHGFNVGLFRNMAGWNSRNLVTELIGKEDKVGYVCVKYENLTKDPISTLESILSEAGSSTNASQLVQNDTVYISENHTIWGNPKRYKKGCISIYHDEEWKRKYPDHLKSMTTLLSLPLLYRYGYI